MNGVGASVVKNIPTILSGTSFEGMKDEDIQAKLIGFIDRKHERHSANTLREFLFSNEKFRAVDPDLVEFAFETRDEIIEYLSDDGRRDRLVKHLIHSVEEYISRRNQFLNISGSYETALREEYSAFLERLRGALEASKDIESLTGSYSDILGFHLEKLRMLLYSYCVASVEASVEESPLLGNVPNEEYSAEFQLGVLNIEISELLEPVLDVGCGASGRLVGYLDGVGIESYGVDRFAPSGGNFFKQDWFDYDYGICPWGTVIAHQSISTHFIFNHLHSGQGAARYAALFMKIISSLKEGGTVYYAPGLPFFERELEKTGSYVISRTAVDCGDLPGIEAVSYSVRLEPVTG